MCGLKNVASTVLPDLKQIQFVKAVGIFLKYLPFFARTQFWELRQE